jgi:hypothetical protein
MHRSRQIHQRDEAIEYFDPLFPLRSAEQVTESQRILSSRT